MPVEFGEIIQPFDVGQWNFVHVEHPSLLKKQKGRFSFFIKEELLKYPDDLLCDVGSNLRLFRRRLKETTRDPNEVQAAVDAYKAKEAQRMTVEAYLGDVYPISFVGLKGSSVVGGFQLYGIQIVRNGIINCHPFPITGRMFRAEGAERATFFARMVIKLVVDGLVTKGRTLKINELDIATLGPTGASSPFAIRHNAAITTRIAELSSDVIITGTKVTRVR